MTQLPASSMLSILTGVRGAREAHRSLGQQDSDREVAGAVCKGTDVLHFPPAAAECLRKGEEEQRAFSGCMEGLMP